MAYIGQNEDEWEASQRKKQRNAAKRASVRCPRCGSRCVNQGALNQHLRDAHGEMMLFTEEFVDANGYIVPAGRRLVPWKPKEVKGYEKA